MAGPHRPPAAPGCAAGAARYFRAAELRARGRRLERALSRNSGFSELQMIIRAGDASRLCPRAACVLDGVYDQVEVGPVEPDDGVAEADRCCGGEAGGQVEDGRLAA